ncbi:MAG: hypothetical protein KUG78_10570 [Kangiellaceae bacterium]|nr:hypothetical protein [Kangiellaceae bacterium]
MNKYLLTIAILFLVPFGVTANSLPDKVLELGYTAFDFKDGLTAEGFKLRISSNITEHFFVEVKSSLVVEEQFDFQLSTLGAGFKANISDNVALYSKLSFVDFSATNYDEITELSKLANGDGTNDTGTELAIGMRTLLFNDLEMNIALEQLDIENTKTTSLIISGTYNFNQRFGVYANYSHESELSIYTVGLRVNF